MIEERERERGSEREREIRKDEKCDQAYFIFYMNAFIVFIKIGFFIHILLGFVFTTTRSYFMIIPNIQIFFPIKN